MVPNLRMKGEIPLEIEQPNFTALDSLEDWQADEVTSPESREKKGPIISNCLSSIDQIVDCWLENLTQQDWEKIARQQSLFGIPLPTEWIKVWRVIIRDPDLRDPEKGTRSGRNVGTHRHLWNVWSEDCIKKYLGPMEKDLIGLVDSGSLYSEVGIVMLGRYGDNFWKKRKENSKTTPAQVVSNYLYNKLPTQVVRGELLEICLKKIEKESLERLN